MKIKYLSICLLLCSLLFKQEFAFAEADGIDLSKLDYRYNAVIENFLWNLQNENHLLSYGKTAGFLAKIGFDNFKKNMKNMGLMDFTENKWTYYKDEMGQIGVVTAKGEFKTSDGITHYLTFYFIIGGETEIRIGNIVEEIPDALLHQRFPNTENLQILVLNDLTAFLPFLRNNRTKDFYNALSQKAKARITLKDVRKAFRQLRKIKKQIYLPKKAQITIAQKSPQLNRDGLMMIDGVFQNKKAIIGFTLGYDYEEWNWKLGLMGVDAQNKQ